MIQLKQKFSQIKLSLETKINNNNITKGRNKLMCIRKLVFI